MKKRLILIVLFLLVLSGCRSNDVKKAVDLPIDDSMELRETIYNTVEGRDIEVPIYTINDKEFETFLDEYEVKLKEEGWTIVNDLKPNGLKIRKNNNNLMLFVYEQADELILEVLPTQEEDD